MEEEMSEELNPSELGTKNYWEKIYAEEINNFEDHGDVGEVWFGKNNALKVIKCICENLKLDKTDKIIDIGCGNGWTLVQLAKRGFTNLIGVDYVESALELAKAVLTEHQIDASTVQLMVCDILDATDDLFSRKFTLVHDKGTYDAISLNPENPMAKRMIYIDNVSKIIIPDGYLVLSSCNWTETELLNHFQHYFHPVLTIEAPTMKFGGKIGKSVTNVIFKKKKNE